MINVNLIAGLTRAVVSAVGGDMKKLANQEESVISDIAANSLVELGQVTNVEVITVVDNSLTMYDSTTDVLKFLNSLYAGWYLSAASIMTDTGRIKTVKLLEKLNPSKNPSYMVANSIVSGAMSSGNVSIASIDVTDTDQLPKRLPRTSNFSLESNDRQEFTAAKAGSDLMTVANLSVGQMVTLSLSDNGAKKDVQIGIRLITIPVQQALLKTIMTWSQKDNRLKTRLSAWRAGELRFWRDVVLMRDIFTERKRILMNDKSDLLQTLLGRQRDSMVSSALTMTPSVGTMSSILVISSDNVRQFEQEVLDGRLKDFRFRQTIMNATGLMVIAVVDPLSEFVTVYTHTQALPAEYSIKQLKQASKGGGNDLGEIIKLMGQNQMPNF